ncbi:hypothetical protein H6P81_019077 [Aristolochia fimbriata]|uniref:Uncharacterized protein n=1 Tax=Aristolochia fimbriata TaxID=158543 RepID=A0AAV7DUD4_ARIFI|nr:hypothetical protein H6P81_019077 [Aristolochia fimbriata]
MFTGILLLLDLEGNIIPHSEGVTFTSISRSKSGMSSCQQGMDKAPGKPDSDGLIALLLFRFSDYLHLPNSVKDGIVRKDADSLSRMFFDPAYIAGKTDGSLSDFWIL